MSDIQNRYDRYVASHGKDAIAIISTTLHNGKHEEGTPAYNKVFFSVHPLNALVGTVDHVYRSSNIKSIAI